MPIVWRLAEQYSDLICFNLVILPGDDIESSTVFFFPRPFRPEWEGPSEHRGINEGKGWSFGAFEMGGFFVLGDESVYAGLTDEAACRYLKQVSIFERPQELQRIRDLFAGLAPGESMQVAIDSYLVAVGQLTGACT